MANPYQTKDTYNLASQIKMSNKSSSVDYFYGPYDSVSEAKSAIEPALRGIGRTIGIVENGIVVEYWWQKNDAGVYDFIPKTLGGVAGGTGHMVGGFTRVYPTVHYQQIEVEDATILWTIDGNWNEVQSGESFEVPAGHYLTIYAKDGVHAASYVCTYYISGAALNIGLELMDLGTGHTINKSIFVEDSGTSIWGKSQLYGANEIGCYNTYLILQSGFTGVAAACYNTLSSEGTPCYCPSIDELQILDLEGIVWSSTEVDANNAKAYNFDTKEVITSPKNTEYNYIAVK